MTLDDLRVGPHPLSGRARNRAAATAALLLATLLFWIAPVRCEAAAPENLEQLARDFMTPALTDTLNARGQAPLRAEVVVGQLDARLRLAPCSRVEPHLPAGTRLWGRSRIGLRCVEGPTRWNVFVPVTVKAWGPAWVLRHPVAAGATLTQEDAEMADVDWAEHPSGILANPALWVGRQAAFGLQPGQALRENMVRVSPAFAAGTQVKVRSAGAGFQVTATGEALGPGVEGQPVRVRLPGGKVVSGLVREGRMVEVGL